MIEPVKRNPADKEYLSLVKFPYGLNKDMAAPMIDAKELSECTDFINKGGKLITRPPLIKASDTAISGSVVASEYAILESGGYTIVAGSDFKLYWMNGKTPTLIGTAEGIPYLIPFHGACLICDGSFLKFIDDKDTIKIAYDAGDGGTQYNNINGTQNAGIKLNDANKRAGVEFTSSAWTAGYTIPPTKVEVSLKRTGTPTGVISVKIRKKSDDSILCTKDVSQDAREIAEAGETVTVVFGTVSTEMTPATGYYATVEYASGTAANYLEVRCSTVASAGAGVHYTTSWATDSTLKPVMKVFPGLPPKCSFGCVVERRPELAGDPDNPGFTWSGNYTYLDFSSENVGTMGGGSVPAVDMSRNSFKVGAIQSLYGKPYIYGTEEQPYLSRREGEYPVDFSFPSLYQQQWATHRTVVNTTNDLFSCNANGVDSLQGVQAYGDVRTFSESDRIQRIIDSHWDTNTAFAGYNPVEGQYMLYLPTYGKVLVCHTKSRFSDGSRVEYPWSEYDLPIVPTCFGKIGKEFSIGAEDGFLYKFATFPHYMDLDSTQIQPFWVSKYNDFVPHSADLSSLQPIAVTKAGATLEISLYEGRQTADPVITFELFLETDGTLLVDDAAVLVEDANFLPTGRQIALLRELNIEASSIMVKMTVTKTLGAKVYIDGVVLEYSGLEG